MSKLFDDSSLAMIPSAVKDGKLYSIRPIPEYGAELVTNGTFATDSGWTKGTGSTISGGSLNIVAAPYNANTKQNISLTSGVTYKVVINYTASGTATSNTFQLGFGDSAGNPSDTTQYEFAEGSGVKTFSITASAGDASILFRSRDAGTCDLSIHSVSVKEAITANGDFTFSRGSNLAATRVDVNGLIEKGRENLLLQSNSFSTSPWGISNATISGGQSGYDGTNNAWIFTTSVNGAALAQTFSTTGIITYSVYAKAGSVDGIRLRIDTNSDANGYFDLVDGTSTSSGAIDSSIEDIGSGWYRCSVSHNVAGAVKVQFFTTDSTGSYDNGSIYIQDAQLEQGLVATDYIETGATSAQAGILEDLPRLDYSGGASCPSLLLEPLRTNTISKSEYISSYSSGGGAGVTMTANYGISPEGVKNSTRIQYTSGNSYVYSNYATATASGQSFTISIYAKGIAGEQIRLHASGSSGISFNQELTLSGEWQRFYATGTTGSAGQVLPHILVGYGSSNPATDFQVYGWQCEQASYPTSYIPTYGSAVTRSEDSAANANISSLYVQNGSTLFFEIECDGEVDEFNVTNILRLGTSINTSRVGFLQGYNRIYSTWYDGSTNAFGTINTLDAGSRVKVAVQLTNNGIGRINGGVNGIGNTIKDYTLSSENYTRLEIYRSSRFKQLMIFPTLLTASEMEALTTL